MSSPVRTVTTSGIESAAAASRETISACACGERSTAAWAVPGRSPTSSAKRSSLPAGLDYPRKGDVLVVFDLDWLGRRAGELITLIDELDRRGIGFRALNSPMETIAPAGQTFLQIRTAFVEMERNVIRKRIIEGEKAARARGRKGERPRTITAKTLRYARRLTAYRSRSIPALCRELGGLPTSTLNHYLAADGTPAGPGRRLLEA